MPYRSEALGMSAGRSHWSSLTGFSTVQKTTVNTVPAKCAWLLYTESMVVIHCSFFYGHLLEFQRILPNTHENTRL